MTHNVDNVINAPGNIAITVHDSGLGSDVKVSTMLIVQFTITMTDSMVSFTDIFNFDVCLVKYLYNLCNVINVQDDAVIVLHDS